MISWRQGFAAAAFAVAFFFGLLAAGDFVASVQWARTEPVGGISAEAHLWRGIVFGCVAALFGAAAARLWRRRD